MLKFLLTTLSIALCISVLSQKHSHEHVPSNARELWGDFDSTELIKISPVDYTNTPIYSKISKKGELKEEFRYLEKLEIFNMVYSSDNLMVTGFLVKPIKEGNYPCIIYNRGGNRDHGSLLVGNAVVQMGKLASDGYIVIASNYRGNSNSEGKEEFGGSDVVDVLNLIPALGQIEGADTSRIGMLGVSRGGMMTYLAMKKSSRIKAAVTIGGMANLFTMKNDRPDMEGHVYAALIPNYKDSMQEALIQRSAVFWAGDMHKKTKLLMLHGAKDKRVSIEEARELHEQLDLIGFPHVFAEFKKGNHGIRGQSDKVAELISEWFREFVALEKPYTRNENHIIID